MKEATELMHARMLESDETLRMAGLSPADMANQALALEVESAQLRQAYASGTTWPVDNIRPTWLLALGLEVSPEDPLRPLLAREPVKARLRGTKARQERQGGELVGHAARSIYGSTESHPGGR